MKLLPVLILMALVLSGCASTVWVNRNKSENEFYSDLMACQEYANNNSQQHTPQMQLNGNTYNDSFAAGWNQGAAIGDNIASSSRNNKLVSICLKSKGWREETK